MMHGQRLKFWFWLTAFMLLWLDGLYKNRTQAGGNEASEQHTGPQNGEKHDGRGDQIRGIDHGLL